MNGLKLNLPEWAQWLLVLGGLYLVYRVYESSQQAAIAAAPAPAPPQLALPAPASENWIDPNAIGPTSLGEAKTEQSKETAGKKKPMFDADFWKMRENQSKWGVN